MTIQTVTWETEINERPVRVSVDLELSYSAASKGGEFDIGGLSVVALDTNEPISILLTEEDRHWLISEAIDRYFTQTGA